MYKGKKVTAVVLGAGSSCRMGFDKLFYNIDGMPVIWHSVNKFACHAMVDDIVVVAGQNMQQVKQLFKTHSMQKPLKVVAGGTSRMASVLAGALVAGGQLVAIHDAARPFVSEEIISAAVKAGLQFNAAAPAVAVKDTIKTLAEGAFVAKSLKRESLVAMQTPQVFNREAFLLAAEKVPADEYENFSDDCMVMENAGHAVKLVGGEYANYKITTPEDIAKKNSAKKAGDVMFRVGHGYDVHKFANNRRLVLGGVVLPYAQGLAGHSDADVVLHAVCDALFGAAAMGDIGGTSLILLRHIKMQTALP